VLQYYHGSGHPSKDWVSKVERRVHSFESIMEDDSVQPRVYLDMDGVLADFFGEWSRISGVDHYKDINDVESKLQLVRDHPTFWVDLPMLPHAKALIKAVVEKYGEYRICSKPLEGDTRSKPGKMEWIQKHLSDMPPAEVILTADKAKFATHDGAPNILVDDYGVNINSWRAAGGIGIKYDDSAFPQVAKILSSIAKSGVSK
jgi:5'(3')-deoxyribonucleotidase